MDVCLNIFCMRSLLCSMFPTKIHMFMIIRTFIISDFWFVKIHAVHLQCADLQATSKQPRVPPRVNQVEQYRFHSFY